VKVHLYPLFEAPDNGDGGIRRVAEGMQRHLPAFGWEITTNPAEADVIACHATIPAEYLRLYPRATFVAHCHGLYWSEYEWAPWALKANREVMEAIRVADAVTAPSEWVAQIIRRHTNRPAIAVPHGVEFEDWQQPRDLPATLPPAIRSSFVWWDKSRPDPICDPSVVNAVARQLPDVDFVSTFGEPAHNVTITGRLPYDVAGDVTRNAGVYLATSRETFGIATLQAMAAGVPVVGYRWGANPEIIVDEVDGLLVEPGDIDALAASIRYALDPGNRALGERGREAARWYTWERAAERYAGIYTEAWERRNAPGPRTTVLVTAYNLAETLPATLASVVAQDDPDWECVIVDDASPDACGAIADEWAAKDSRFRAIHNPANLYLAGARNAGIFASRGRYVLPLDADDMLPAAAVRTLAEALDTDRTIHIAYGNVEFLEPDGKIWLSGWPVEFRWEAQLAPPREGSRPMNLLPYSSMFRREVVEWTGGYRMRLRTAEDADLWCRVSSYGFRPRMVTDAPCLTYRNREGSMSRTHEPPDWTLWYPWARDVSRAPAGAVAAGQLPVPSLTPPVLAVVIPVGPGHGRYVLDAVDSVDAQTIRQWECIVANDTGCPLPWLPSWVRVIEPADCGSCHGAGQVEGREDPDYGVRVEICPTCHGTGFGRFGGVAAARNAAIEASSAPMFLPLDADDYLEPWALEAMLAAAAATGYTDPIYSDFWEDPHTEGEYQIFETPDFEADLLIRAGLPWAVTTLTARALWEEVGGYDTALPAWEDWAFALALAERGVCFTRVAMPLWTYRKHTGKRRDENFGHRDDGEAAIRARFGRFWEGDSLMGCSSCGGSRPSQPGAGDRLVTPGIDPLANNPDVVLFQFVGPQAGGMTFRTPSNQTYRFESGEVRYVLGIDEGYFAARPEFRQVMPETVPTEPPEAPRLTSSTPAEAFARDVAAGARRATRVQS
jgi:glycosyltransferase involved in cell wall biosynthesis